MLNELITKTNFSLYTSRYILLPCAIQYMETALLYGRSPYQSITVIALNATMFLQFHHLSQYTHTQALCIHMPCVQPLVDYINEQATLGVGSMLSSYI